MTADHITIAFPTRLLEHPRGFHIHRMRASIWLYLALLVRLPSGSDRLSVSPADLARTMGLPEGTVVSWLGHLRKCRYVEARRRDVRVVDVMTKDRPYDSFSLRTPAHEVIQRVAASEWQDAFPVLEDGGKLAGVITTDILRTTAAEPDVENFALAADMMSQPLRVSEGDDLRKALELILEHGVRELIVTNDAGRIIGFLDEADITRVYHEATAGKS